MSSGYIGFSSDTKGGSYVTGIVNAVITSWYQSQRLKAVMDSIIGFPADYSTIEPIFGLQAGTGQAFYNTIVGLKAALDTACVPITTLDKVA